VSYLSGSNNVGGLAVDEVFGAFLGPQAYSGTEAAPLFAPTLTPFIYAISLNNGFATDYLSISAVPEPAAWLLMLAGLGMVGATLRLGRRKTAALAV
jgi:hypothetical protein